MAMTWKRSSYSGNNGGNCVEVGFDWRKSSYSENNGGNCVEIGAHWQKSSHSGNDGGNCVEIGTVPSAPHLLIRDSKRAAEPATPVLHLSPAAFTAFLTAVSST
ncbi:DUF397 domain-containing protein [Streptomyces sp. SID11385]|uniref:DUF397 domain-containing protein n=1 Tax=Streptomyces sp. SID11385 TaxID=2706031 RepID=UPI0013C96871|nr:DUF397 domain-containing protein [Streptomyces sp. SID11385]